MCLEIFDFCKCFKLFNVQSTKSVLRYISVQNSNNCQMSSVWVEICPATGRRCHQEQITSKFKI